MAAHQPGRQAGGLCDAQCRQELDSARTRASRAQAWWTVKRQAMTADAHEPVGLYFGTTSGEVWASRTGGMSWACCRPALPEIYSVEAAELCMTVHIPDAASLLY